MQMQIVYIIITYIATILTCVAAESNNKTNCADDSEVLVNQTCTENCLRKCCPFNEYFDGYTCQNDNNTPALSVDIYDVDKYKCTLQNNGRVNIKFAECTAFFYSSKTFFTQDDGSLWIPVEKRFAAWNEYCMDNTKDEEEWVLMGIICITHFRNLVDRIAAVCLVIAIPFLTATCVSYILLPEQTTHIKFHISYLATLTIATSVDVYWDFYIPNDITCAYLGYFYYFLSMSYFYWLNAIAINVWKTFGTHFTESRLKPNQNRQFMKYSLYVWGLALFQTILILIFDVGFPDTSSYDPGFLNGNCSLSSTISIVLYNNLPQGISLSANIIIFINTSVRIRRIDNSFRKYGQRHYLRYQQRTVIIYIRLFLLMGLNCIIDLFLWITLEFWYTPAHYNIYIWYFIKLHNAAYGISLFFIFICKKSILKQLKERFCKTRLLPNRLFQTTTTRSSKC